MRALLTLMLIAGCSPLIDTGEAPDEDGGPQSVDVGGPVVDARAADARYEKPLPDGSVVPARDTGAPQDRGVAPSPRDLGPPADRGADPPKDLGVEPAERLGVIGADEPFDDTGTQGGPPGPFFYGHCDGEDDLLVGVDAKLDDPDVISALRPRCARFEVWRTGDELSIRPLPSRAAPWLGDDDAGGDQSFECPPGMVVSDYGGGVSVILTGLYLGCAPLLVEPAGEGVRVTRGEMFEFGEIGEPDSGADYIGADCPERMGAVALMVDLNPIGLSSFTRFGLECGTPRFWPR